jgi:hypothetical protein
LSPAAGLINPYPLVGLNHLTVPFCIVGLLVRIQVRDDTSSLRFSAPQRWFWESPCAASRRRIGANDQNQIAKKVYQQECG